MHTARHWSGFLISLEETSAHFELIGAQLSSPKHEMECSVDVITAIALICARESEISSS